MSRREFCCCTLNAKKSTFGPGSVSFYAERYFEMQYVPLIVIHTGAGRYSKKNDAQIKRLCDKICRLIMERLKAGLSSLSGAEMAVQMLEDSPLTNAGYGSHLNASGKVECDAAIMCSVDGKFGCVASIPGVKNPIKVARRLLEGQRNPKPTSLVAPVILAGQGAREFAISEALPTFMDPGALVSPESLRKYHAYEKILMRDPSNDRSALGDTVGAIVSDLDGKVAVALSSGGINHKRPGRVGDTAIPGAGFWIQKRDSQCSACCTTGTGEQLIYTDFARSICNMTLSNRSVDSVLSAFLCNFSQLDFQIAPSAGFICLINDDCDDRRVTEVWYGFTTEGMCVAHLWGNDGNPECRVERLESGGGKYRIMCQSFFHPRNNQQ